MHSHSRFACALPLAGLLFALTACSQNATSPLPSSPVAENPGQLSPDILERGPTPVQWAMFAHVANTTHYASPVADLANNIWFESGSSIERINYSGSNLGTFATITSGPLANLTLGGDGNIWYTFTNQSKPSNPIVYVFAVSSSGAVVHEYKIPDSGTATTIARGLGNDMWVGGSFFTTFNTLYRIRNNQLQPFDGGDFLPLSAAVNSDGNVGFVGTNSAGEFMVKLNTKTNTVSTDGEVIQTPARIVVGSDGNWWSLDTGSKGSVLVRVDRVTGARTNIGVGLHILMTDLVSGPDGNLWIAFHTSTTTGVMQVSPPSGKVLKTFACPAQFCVNAPSDFAALVTNAPDGNIYFAYNGVDSHTGIGAYVRLSMTITPSSVIFADRGDTQLLKIAEANYSGTWTVATRTPAVVKVVSRPAANEALIQAVGKGTGRVIVRDTRNNYYGVTVTVL